MDRTVKAFMTLSHIKNRDIAKKAKVSETWVSLVVCGHRKSPRIRSYIAEELGKEVSELWPEDSEAA